MSATPTLVPLGTQLYSPKWQGLISVLEPADDTALQNRQRKETRLQYVPYLWAAPVGRFIRSEKFKSIVFERRCPLHAI